MIQAYLRLEWFDDDGNMSDFTRTDAVELVCLPRIGERMLLDDDIWTTVTDILHVAEWKGDYDHSDDMDQRPSITVIMRVQPSIPPIFVAST